MSRYQCIDVETQGDVLWVILNRPAALNSISSPLVAELSALLDAFDFGDMAAIRALIITGAGRAFCAGGDLKELENGTGGHASGEKLYGAITRTLARFERLGVPTIAAVNGLCVAGGLEIALSCDLVVADEKARFGDGHANFGLVPGGGGSIRLPRKVGPNRAAYMMMTGRLFPAEILRDWGLVLEIAPEGQLRDCASQLATELAKKSPAGLKAMKSLIFEGLDLPMKDALELEQAFCMAHDKTNDRNEGLAAFVEKRTPNFRGS